jgi:hypothetical protein
MLLLLGCGPHITRKCECLYLQEWDQSKEPSRSQENLARILQEGRMWFDGIERLKRQSNQPV